MPNYNDMCKVKDLFVGANKMAADGKDSPVGLPPPTDHCEASPSEAVLRGEQHPCSPSPPPLRIVK